MLEYMVKIAVMYVKEFRFLGGLSPAFYLAMVVGDFNVNRIILLYSST